MLAFTSSLPTFFATSSFSSTFTRPPLLHRRRIDTDGSLHTVHSGAATKAARPVRGLRMTAASGDRIMREPVPNLRVNEQGGVLVSQRTRPRRLRRNETIRSMVRETVITPDNLIYPLFVHEKAYNEDIASMPGTERHSEDSVVEEVGRARLLGVKSIILFPKIAEALKTNTADECYNPDGLIPRMVRRLKTEFPDVMIWTDIALDPYSDQGHDGIVSSDRLGENGTKGRILNDETVEQLCRQALAHARAGADVVAPSDMMDGRIGAIRDALDIHGFTDVAIVAYTAKYASAYYGPFRDALDSAPRESSNAPTNKKTYQMDPANGEEAMMEARLDVGEGADMLMVKPGLPYLDIIRRLKDSPEVTVPVAAYHVSGEYAMMKAAAQNGWLDERETVLETLLCFRRAGADAILTYYAKQAAQWMQEN